MEEIDMISKVKELTESAAKMDLKSTPVFNMEKRLKEIKTMMNKVCAKYMNKKSECKELKTSLEHAHTQIDKYQNLQNAEMMQSEAIIGNESSKYDDLINKNANKDV